MAKLKVYGGTVFRDGRQRRAVVAVTSQKEAARIVGVSLHHIRGWWCETGNKKEIADAMERPGTLVTYPDNFGP